MTDKPPNTPGGLTGLIGQILSYIDKPWKAVVVAGLGILAVSGYIFWEQRGAIVQMIMESPLAKDKLISNLDFELETMVRGTKADVVSVWLFDLGANNVTYVDGVNKGDGPWRPADWDMPDELPAIVDGTNSKALVSILQGKPFCIDTSIGWGIFISHSRKSGFKQFCAVPIHGYRTPPFAIVVLSYKEPLDDGSKESALSYAENESYDMLDTPKRNR